MSCDVPLTLIPLPFGSFNGVSACFYLIYSRFQLKGFFLSKQGSEKNQTDIGGYLDTLWLERGLSENTLMAYRRDLLMTADWLDKQSQGQILLQQADKKALFEFMAQRKKAGVSDRSAARWLSTLRGFYRHMIFTQRLLDDPTQKLEHPKLGRSLPSSLSSEPRWRRCLAAPDVTTATRIARSGQC